MILAKQPRNRLFVSIFTTVDLAGSIVLLVVFVVSFKDRPHDRFWHERQRHRPPTPTSSVGMSSAASLTSEVHERILDFGVDVTFEDPRFYSGPVVPGWPPERDRDMRKYIRPGEDTVVNEDASCFNLTGATRLLIAVQSSPEKFDRRQTNRRTWMKFSEEYPGLKVLHFMGRTGEPVIQKLLSVEQSRFCDIVQLDFYDTVFNATLDAVSTLKFVLTAHDGDGDDDDDKGVFRPDFVIMVGDDAYVNVPAVWQLLFDRQAMFKNSTFLVGSKYTNTSADYPSSKAAQFVKRLETPTYLYNLAYYPDYLGGGAFVMPLATLKCLYEEALVLPYFHFKDIFITGFAAERCDFQRIGVPGFNTQKSSLATLRLDDLILHYASNWNKLVIHAVLSDQNGVLVPCLPFSYCAIDGVLHFCREVPFRCTKIEAV